MTDHDLTVSNKDCPRCSPTVSAVEQVADVLAGSDLADHIRDARSTENPCRHWVGQPLPVCAPCVRDRIIPHITEVLAIAGCLRDDRDYLKWRRETLDNGPNT